MKLRQQNLMFLILATFFYPIIKKAIKNKKENTSEKKIFSYKDPTKQKSDKSFYLNWDALFCLSILILFLLSTLQSKEWSIKAGLFPWVISAAVIPLLGIELYLEVITKAGLHRKFVSEENHPKLPSKIAYQKTVRIIAWIFGFFVCIWLFEFPMALPVMTFLYLKFDAREKLLLSIILPLFVWVFIYGLFESILHIPFPEGQLFRYF